ncbi:hypothetical protein N0V83_004994 [Neocucurbitaria cava]|uniref:Uncharacterized protein n=1 Tax=Neocucurbitaria cava TaxID=798079 RepID=A0A9W8Y9V6_9PLEO|nr:hypothetical protein N0V83_004994 [Neocucurbitaria cava]
MVMDSTILFTPSPYFGRFPPRWPQVFATPRGPPKDDRPFIDELRKLGSPHTGVKLFMQPYDDDKTSFDLDIVARFCEELRPPDSNNGISSNKGTAWLDDHPMLPISELAAHDAFEHLPHRTGRNGLSLNARLTMQPEQPNENDRIGCDNTGSLEISPIASASQAIPRPRTYPECLTARDLQSRLREKRFNHEFLEDADRRLIRIADPDPLQIQALTDTAPGHQCSALQDILCQYIEQETSLKVKIPSKGYPVFQLELHLPYFALRQTSQGSLPYAMRIKPHRGWMNLSFLDDECEESVWGIHQAQFSLTICGSDNSRWVAYCLEDISFDDDRAIGDDERVPGWRSDQISKGQLNANLPFRDPREYFLTICLIRITHIVQETRDLVRKVEASYRRNTLCQSFFASSGGENFVALDWTQAMLGLLSILIPDISKKTDNWARFSSADKDIGYFEDSYSTLPPCSRTHIQNNLVALDKEFDELKDFEKRLGYIEERCEKLAARLEHHLVWQGSKNGEFTLVVISPIVIVASVFAIPGPVVVFDKNPLSLCFSIALGMLSMHIVMLFRRGWLHRQRWWEKLSRRTKAAWNGGGTITIQNEAGSRVLRRRSTHVGFSREE